MHDSGTRVIYGQYSRDFRLLGIEGYRRIFVDSDSLGAIKCLASPLDSPHPACFSLVHQILQLEQQGGSFIWGHLFREGNQVADALAKFGLGHPSLDCRVFFRLFLVLFPFL